MCAHALKYIRTHTAHSHRDEWQKLADFLCGFAAREIQSDGIIYVQVGIGIWSLVSWMFRRGEESFPFHLGWIYIVQYETHRSVSETYNINSNMGNCRFNGYMNSLSAWFAQNQYHLGCTSTNVAWNASYHTCRIYLWNPCLRARTVILPAMPVFLRATFKFVEYKGQKSTLFSRPDFPNIWTMTYFMIFAYHSIDTRLHSIFVRGMCPLL